MEGYGVPGVILCTCNRSEFYAIEPTGDPLRVSTDESADLRVVVARSVVVEPGLGIEAPSLEGVERVRDRHGGGTRVVTECS